MPKKFSDEELLELYYQGLTNREIADQLRVSQPAVYYRLQGLGLMNNCQRKEVVDVNQVKILHGMGVTSIGIALLLKVSAHNVQKHLKKLGLEDNYYKLKRLVA